MRRRLAAGACVLLAALAACELREISLAEPDDIVIVEAILRAGAASQKVLLQRSFGLGAPPAAEIAVTRDDGMRLVLRPAPDSTCLVPTDTVGPATSACYAHPDGAFIRPGARYDLRVETADGRVLTGNTRVPGAFEVLTPASIPCTLPAETTLEMRWTAAGGAWVYIVETNLHGLRAALGTRGIEVPGDPLRLVGLSITRADTTIVFPTEFGLFDRFDSDLSDVLVALQTGLPAGITAELVVGAADRNYVNWVRGGNFNPSGTVRVASVHGAGGTGVFGSVVTRERTVSTRPGESHPAC